MHVASSTKCNCIFSVGLYAYVTPEGNVRSQGNVSLGGFLSSLGCIDGWVRGGAYCVLAGRIRTAKSYLWLIQFKTKLQ